MRGNGFLRACGPRNDTEEGPVRGMEYTKADYIRFIGELLELLPVGFVKKIYSVVAIERKRAGV